jgi:hypothetical protein
MIGMCMRDHDGIGRDSVNIPQPVGAAVDPDVDSPM